MGCSKSCPPFFPSSSTSSFFFVPFVCHLWCKLVIPFAAEMKMDNEQPDFHVNIGCGGDNGIDRKKDSDWRSTWS